MWSMSWGNYESKAVAGGLVLQVQCNLLKNSKKTFFKSSAKSL